MIAHCCCEKSTKGKITSNGGLTTEQSNSEKNVLNVLAMVVQHVYAVLKGVRVESGHSQITHGSASLVVA